MFGLGGGFLHQIKISLVGENALSGPIKSAIGDLEKLQGSVNKLKSIGKTMMIAGGVMAAAMILPAKGAIDLEAGMIDVRKTTNLTMEDINSGIAGLVDKKIPTAVDGLSKIAATAGQLGIKGKENIFAFTEEVAKIEAVSDLAADEAATAFAQFSNVFDLGVMKVGNMGSAVNELSNNTTATARFITESMARIGRPIDSLTFDHLAGLAATISDVGLGAERGGTAFRNIFTRMQTQAADTAKVMGVSTNQWAETVQKDGMGAFISLLEKLREVDATSRTTTIASIFGEMSVVPIQKMVNKIDLLKNNLSMANNAFDDNVSLNKELENVMEGAGAQLTVFLNQMKLLLASIGKVLLPPLNAILAVIGPIVSWFRDFSEAHPIITGVVVGTWLLISAILILGGMALWMAGMMASAMLSIQLLSLSEMSAVGTTNLLKMSLVHLKTALIGVGRAMITLLANPVVLAIVAIAALAYGIYLLIKHWDEVKAAFAPLISMIADGFTWLYNWFKGWIGDWWYVVLLGLTGPIGLAIGLIIKYWDVIVAAFDTAWGWIKGVFASAWKWIIAFWAEWKTVFIGAIFGPFGIAWGLIVKYWEQIKGVFAAAKDWIIGKFTEVWDWVAGLPGRFYAAGAGLIDAFKNGMLARWEAFKAPFVKMIAWIRDNLTGSDAKRGPLSDLTRSGQAFFPTFAKGMEQGFPRAKQTVEAGMLGLAPVSNSTVNEGNTTSNKSASKSVTIQLGDIHIKSDNPDEALKDFKAKLRTVLEELGVELTAGAEA
jgi:TP901 family phage tail tape measure protein